jgi:hypothetical protein
VYFVWAADGLAGENGEQMLPVGSFVVLWPGPAPGTWRSAPADGPGRKPSRVRFRA